MRKAGLFAFLAAGLLGGVSIVSGDDETFVRIPVDHGAARLLVEAREAADGGDFDRAARIYRDLLEERETGVVPSDREGVHRGVVALAEEGLRSLPPEGMEAYRRLVQVPSDRLLEESLARRDLRGVASVATVYPGTDAGLRACRILADMAIEAGDAGMARRYVSRMGLSEAMAASRLDPIQSVLEAPPEGTIVDLPRPSPFVAWQRNARAGADQTARSVRYRGYWPDRRTTGEARYFYPNIPTVRDGIVYIAGPDTLTAVFADTGKNISPHSDMQPTRIRGYRERNPQALYSVAADSRCVYGTFVTEVSPAESFPIAGGGTIEIKPEIPTRKLMALDPWTGRKLWGLDESRDPFVQKASFPAPPILRGQALYVPATVSEGYIQSYLCAVSPRDGEIIWKAHLGSGVVETTMFVYYGREPLATPAAESRGIIYQCTNLGVMAAVRAEDGAILWLSQYESIPVEAARYYHKIEREIGWAPNPPVVVDNRVIVAPLDSDHLHAFDIETGEEVWKVLRSQHRVPVKTWNLRYLIGGHDGKVLVSGRHAAALHVEDGSIAWVGPDIVRELEWEPGGRGAILGDALAIPARDRRSPRDGYLLITDLATGKSRMNVEFKKTDMGNFIHAGDILVLAFRGQVRAYRNLEEQVRRHRGR